MILTCLIAVPGLGRPAGCTSDRTQTTQFGVTRVGRLGDQVADQNGGSRTCPVPMVSRCEPDGALALPRRCGSTGRGVPGADEGGSTRLIA